MTKIKIEDIKLAMEILEIKPLMSYNDIKKKYKEKVNKYHPDKNNVNNTKIQEINWAYKILKDYIENYKFTFTEEEILRQFPDEFNLKKFY